MARHIWSVLCSKVLQSIRNNQISLIDTLEKVTVNSEAPAEGTVMQLGFPLTMVTYISRSDWDVTEAGAVRVSLELPSGERHTPHEIEFVLEDDPKARVIMDMQGMPAGQPGVHWFVVEGRGADADVDPWQEWARIPMEVEYQAPPSGEPTL